MAIRRLDALVDAYSHLNGYHDPKSDAYQLRNPLLLKAFSPKHERDEQGRRRFPSFAAGYDNAILDARIKCMGKSFSKLTPDSTLTDLTGVNLTTTNLNFVIGVTFGVSDALNVGGLGQFQMGT